MVVISSGFYVIRPQDKALVENAVNLIYRHIYPSLKNTFAESMTPDNFVAWFLSNEWDYRVRYTTDTPNPCSCQGYGQYAA